MRMVETASQSNINMIIIRLKLWNAVAPPMKTGLDNYQVLTAEQMGGGTSADYLTARIARKTQSREVTTFTPQARGCN